MNNSMQLKDKLKNISNKDNLEFNVVLRNYMYERFIERLACSKYKDNFILKGGYYLSSIFGLNYRQTMDIDLKSYNLETILSEKLETILSRKELNGRLKDFYDIYLIYTLAKEKLDNDILRKAVYNTFKKREFNDDINEAFKIIEVSYVLRLRWKSYVRHNKYAKDILYEDIMNCLKEFIEILETVSI